MIFSPRTSLKSFHMMDYPSRSQKSGVRFHRGTWVSLAPAARPHFSRAVSSFLFFPSHQHHVGFICQFPSSSLFCLFPADRLLCSSYCPWLCLPSPLPYVHTLFSSVRSENAIIECVGIQLDLGDMLFLPISFTPFRRLNNVCVRSASARSDARDADGSHQYAKRVIRMTPSADWQRISDKFHPVILPVKMR